MRVRHLCSRNYLSRDVKLRYCNTSYVKPEVLYGSKTLLEVRVHWKSLKGKKKEFLRRLYVLRSC